ncbi:xanthine dehydrogenase-like [Cimex lectularius]|uniref:xanthine dehydrogenase n=1 Tax=Cimex lectularius TaxID=79782 RepID=A0A8I6RWA6_CIMLE|nr:xanthine dehydrogenase-like [Cimex lectularius]
MDTLPTKVSTLVFYVNGKKIEDPEVDPEWTLLYYLRSKLRLCGTKLGCAEGGCGACTVTLSRYDRKKDKMIHLAVNACLAPVASMHGCAVTTIEGIGSVDTKLHPVQERLAKAHGSQCGFCTPGIIMSMYALLRSRLPGKPTMKDMEIAFQGNLCRCTGYRPIIEGYKTFTEEWEEQQRMNGDCNGVEDGACAMGADCCRLRNENGLNGLSNGEDENDKLYDVNQFTPYDPTQELIFPPELMVCSDYDTEFILFKNKRTSWYRPQTLSELLTLKKKFPNAKIVNGNTEIGVEVKFKNFHYPVFVFPNQISDITNLELEENCVKVGAAVTLNELQSYLIVQISELPEHKTKIFKAIVDILHWFAGKQIRNVGTIGGNIMTGSPISDMNPILMAGQTMLEVQSYDRGKKTIPMDHTFWTGYRRNVVQPDEVLTAVFIPYTKEGQHFNAYKQARRRDDDIAIVTGALNVSLDSANVIKNIQIAYGGMAPTTLLLKTSVKKLIGMKWDKEMLNEAYNFIRDEVPLDPGAPGGMIRYRRSLTLSFFFKFFMYVCYELEKEGWKFDLPNKFRSGPKQFHALEPKTAQYYTKVQSTQDESDFLRRSIVHRSAFKQATGEAIYCDDIPKFENELFLSLVVSTKAHAKIVNIDPSAALAMEGVVAFFSAKDVPKELNHTGPVIQDEEVFASEKVTSQGQVIGAIVAVDQVTARRANAQVKITYEELSPIIVSIEEAIKHNSFFQKKAKVISKGDIEQGFATADVVFEGTVRMGGQEHFYLETHASIVVPKKEDDEMDIHISTQHPSEIQHLISHFLNIPSNRLTIRVKRMGGGFGGKESRGALLALPIAFAAKKLKRPVRGMLDRDEDMMITGQRHPFFAKYKVGAMASGKITTLEVDIYNNGGYSLDLSESVLERAMFHVTNAFYIPNLVVRGLTCKTNMPSNTAFRGFGGPQGMFVGENIVERVAEVLNLDVVKVREINLYNEGDETHYNQKLDNCMVRKCWAECLRMANYEERKKQVELFNSQNRWKKRGISVIPTMFGIAFTALFLNQAGALVLVYSDGSVLLSHGGTEMGQGLHTKMIQVASRTLGISGDLIHISETATDRVPNTSATAASAGSDLNGMAVLNACNMINERLQPIKDANPKGEWKDWVRTAYFSRVSLAASGFYRTPDIGYNMETNTGMAFNYYTFGAACSEVEIDCLTGDYQVLRTDIVMDLGESLNPAIDIGQVEGGFIQGLGLFTLEELVFSSNGMLFSRGPGTYKIPGFADIPAEFNVSLLKGASNPRAVYSSKAVGEPPLFLASSIFFAIREAVKAARKDSGKSGDFQFYSPATSARIRMSCEDEITDQFPEPPVGSFTPWNKVP